MENSCPPGIAGYYSILPEHVLGSGRDPRYFPSMYLAREGTPNFPEEYTYDTFEMVFLIP